MSDRLEEIRVRLYHWPESSLKNDARWLCDEVERLRAWHKALGSKEALEAERDAAIQRAKQAEHELEVRTAGRNIWEKVANKLHGELKQAEADLEQCRVQLAGCAVAALGGAVGQNDATPGMYGWSPAFEDVKKLRAENAKLRAVGEAARTYMAEYIGPEEAWTDVVPEAKALHDALAAFDTPDTSGATPDLVHLPDCEANADVGVCWEEECRCACHKNDLRWDKHVRAALGTSPELVPRADDSGERSFAQFGPGDNEVIPHGTS